MWDVSYGQSSNCGGKAIYEKRSLCYKYTFEGYGDSNCRDVRRSLSDIYDGDFCVKIVNDF